MEIKGFTLIELIIVIGIIALLATTVILVINPARLFQEARDSQRIADLGQMKSAMDLFVATADTPDTSLGVPDLDGPASTATVNCAGRCYIHGTGTSCLGRHVATTAAPSASVAVDGTGWAPVDLRDVSSGSPLAAWPKDPTASGTNFYTYACDNDLTDKLYEFNADMESTRFGSGTGSENVELNDGGSSTTIFEVGSSLSL